MPNTDPLTNTVCGWLSDAHDVWPDDRAGLIAERVRALVAQAKADALIEAANDRAMTGTWRPFAQWLRQRADRTRRETR